MKVMGGYDFPGSNSVSLYLWHWIYDCSMNSVVFNLSILVQNIDLHALTGWIPERWAIRLNEPDFNKDILFDTLLLRLHKGDVLVTVATGELSNSDADRTGLVPSHAYAVLDVRKINVSKTEALRTRFLISINLDKRVVVFK